MAKTKNTFGMLDMGFLTSDVILKNLPFIAFLGALATIYIANAHYAERNVRKIQALQKEIKELRWRYMSLESDNMFNAKRSEIMKNVRKDGFQHDGSPYVLELPE